MNTYIQKLKNLGRKISKKVLTFLGVITAGGIITVMLLLPNGMIKMCTPDACTEFTKEEYLVLRDSIFDKVNSGNDVTYSEAYLYAQILNFEIKYEEQLKKIDVTNIDLGDKTGSIYKKLNNKIRSRVIK